MKEISKFVELYDGIKNLMKNLIGEDHYNLVTVSPTLATYSCLLSISLDDTYIASIQCSLEKGEYIVSVDGPYYFPVLTTYEEVVTELTEYFKTDLFQTWISELIAMADYEEKEFERGH